MSFLNFVFASGDPDPLKLDANERRYLVHEQLERDIENKSVREIKKRFPGARCRKMNGFGFRSWPDRLIILRRISPFFIEFKRPGGELSPGQAHEFAELRKMGVKIYVCDSVTAALAACESEADR